MTDDDITRADALRATTGEETGRRRVLGGAAAAVGALLGLPGAAGARELAPPDASSAPDAPCDPDCSWESYCCDWYGPKCIDWCWVCTCE